MSKYIFSILIFFLLVSALSIATNHQGFSIKILVICFWTLVVGCLAYFFEAYEK